MCVLQDWGTALLNDGLHFTLEGNQHVYEAVQQTINATYPELRCAWRMLPHSCCGRASATVADCMKIILPRISAQGGGPSPALSCLGCYRPCQPCFVAGGPTAVT